MWAMQSSLWSLRVGSSVFLRPQCQPHPPHILTCSRCRDALGSASRHPSNELRQGRLLQIVHHSQLWLMSCQAQLRPQLLLGTKLLMLVQHPLGCPLLLRTLHWMRQLQVCMTPPALLTNAFCSKFMVSL